MTLATLMLLRHAKSDWFADNSTDKDRPLALRGRKDAVRMGQWFVEQNLVPDVTLCSTACRASETINIISKPWSEAQENITHTDAIYEASMGELLKLIDQQDPCEKLLLVGHNPTMDDLLCFLSSTSPPQSDNGKLMTTAAVAVLDYEGEISTEPGSASLRALVRPKDLAKPN